MVSFNFKRRRGEEQSSHILTDKDIPVIREMVREGFLLREIAEKFGVTPQTISKIKNRRTWTHIPLEPEDEET